MLVWFWPVEGSLGGFCEELYKYYLSFTKEFCNQRVFPCILHMCITLLGINDFKRYHIVSSFMQTIWRVHRASTQYTSVALEIHCFGVYVPSHPHASGGWKKEIDSGNDVVCLQYLKKKPVLHFCCHHYSKLTIVFSRGARKGCVDNLVILERAANLQYWAFWFLFSTETCQTFSP